MKGVIFDIQKFSIHDGPGIRTTVFLKGCPLRCVWCHNPESWTAEPELAFTAERCLLCRACAAVCAQTVHTFDGGAHRLDRHRCRACGRCTAACCAQALERVGREATVDEVLADVLRDRPFYETSGGGMTVSGGEPLLQPDFTAGLLRAARDAGLHTCLETCGFAATTTFERLAGLIDLYLYDLKESEEGRHVALTGVGLERILANLRRVHDRGDAIVLRLPLVPGVNATRAHFEGVAALARSLPRLRGVEVLPYHPLGRGKLARLGRDGDAAFVAETPPAATVQQWICELRNLGVPIVNETVGASATG